MKEHQKEVETQRKEIHQKHQETFTVRAKQICNHRPCQHKKNHIFCWEEVTIIGQESDQATRWIREAIRIRQEGQDVMNRTRGSSCCPTFTTTYQRLEVTNTSIVFGLTTLCGYNCSDS